MNTNNKAMRIIALMNDIKEANGNIKDGDKLMEQHSPYFVKQYMNLFEEYEYANMDKADNKKIFLEINSGFCLASYYMWLKYPKIKIILHNANMDIIYMHCDIKNNNKRMSTPYYNFLKKANISFILSNNGYTTSDEYKNKYGDDILIFYAENEDYGFNDEINEAVMLQYQLEWLRTF
jgi:hypothetical protein